MVTKIENNKSMERNQLHIMPGNAMKNTDIADKEADEEVCFTLVEKTGGPCTKIIGLDEAGNLTKDSSQCRITKGTVKKTKKSLKELPAVLSSLNENEALILGAHESEKDEQKIVSEKNYKGQPETITRTKEYFVFPENQNGLCLLDHDPVEGRQSFSPTEIIDIISQVFPQFAGCAKVISHSTSSHIYDEHGKMLSTEAPGHHTYFVAKNSSDFPRFTQVLSKRLYLNSHGYIFITKNGRQLPRTIIDKSVASPERLVFESGAKCIDGLSQNRPEPEYTPGYVLDTSLLKDLTPEEEQKYQDMVKRDKELSLDKATEIRNKYKSEEIKKQVIKGVSKKRAKKIVDQRMAGNLDPEDILYFDKYGAVEIGEVLMDLEKYDEETLSDPDEPDYGGGRNKAMLFANSDNNHPLIHSFAHGERVYSFDKKWPAEYVINKISEKHRQDELDPDYWSKLMFLGHFDPVDEEKILDHLLSLGVGKKRALKSEWKIQRQRLKQHQSKTKKSGKPIIIYSEKNVYDAVLDTDSALNSSSYVGGYYNFAGQLCYVLKHPQHKKYNMSGVSYDLPETMDIQAYNPETLRLNIEQCAEFSKINKNGLKETIPVPLLVIETLLKYPYSCAPRIKGLITHPFIAQDGEIVCTEGFNELTGLLVNFGGADFIFPDKKYSRADSKLATNRIKEKLFSEFEWHNEKVDLVAALGFFLTSLLRKTIEKAPAFLVCAPTPAAGKTTLARVVYITTTGYDMPVYTLSSNTQEAKKEIVSILLTSPAMICFDNVADGTEIKDQILAMIITSPLIKDRLLGGNKMATAPTNTTIAITGNNLSLSSDLNRRVAKISLQPKSADPENRHFNNPDIMEMCLRGRNQNVIDALIIIKSYFDADCPLNHSDYASSGFPEWDRCIRFPLLWATGVDILECITTNKTNSREVQAMESVLSCLYELFGNKPFRAVDVLDKIADQFSIISRSEDEIGLYEGMGVLLENHSQRNTQSIGLVLKKMNGRVLGDFILSIKVSSRGNVYKIEHSDLNHQIDNDKVA